MLHRGRRAPGYGELNKPSLRVLAAAMAFNVPAIVYFRYQHSLAAQKVSGSGLRRFQDGHRTSLQRYRRAS